MSAHHSPWLHTIGPGPDANARLICLPHAGGAATAFVELGRRLAPAIEVLAIQYPGRQERYREACIADIHALADAVHAELGPILDRPVVLFGHSMGALVAYELALRIEREAGRHLLAFVPSGRRGPSTHRPDATPFTDEELTAELRRLSGTDSRLLLDPEMLEVILPALRADYQAIDAYRPEPGGHVRCPVITCVGDADPLTTHEEAHAWRQHAEGPFEVRVFPGGHFYLNESGAELAAVLEHAFVTHR